MNRRAMILPIAVAVSLGLGLGLGACGDDDGDKKLSKSELAKKANKICKTASKEVEDVDSPADLGQRDGDPAAAAAYFTKLAPSYQTATDDLAKLKPDDDIKVAWTQFVERQKQANATLIIVRDKAKASDISGLVDYAKLGRIVAKLTTEAAAVGATECGAS